jgi:hypothetical protein
MTEILLATWSNLHEAFAITAFVSATMTIVCAIFYTIKLDMDGAEEAAPLWRWVKRGVVVFCVALPLALAPTLDDLWKARIALVKYQLAAPENVQQATETIERIATKLECKYLGGCEEAKK